MPTQNSWNNNNTGAASTTLVGSTINISADASAATVNVGTGAAAKTVTIGSTNTTSSLVLQTGTGDFILQNATNSVLNVADTGEITRPMQPAVFAYLGTTDSNATGNGTLFTLGSGNALTEVFDQNSNFVTTGTFTAPVTGRYLVIFQGHMQVPSGATTSEMAINLTSSNRTYFLLYYPSRNRVTNFYAANLAIGCSNSVLIDMDAADTVIGQCSASSTTKTTNIVGSSSVFSFINVVLVC